MLKYTNFKWKNEWEYMLLYKYIYTKYVKQPQRKYYFFESENLWKQSI